MCRLQESGGGYSRDKLFYGWKGPSHVQWVWMGWLIIENIILTKLTLGENCFHEAQTMAITCESDKRSWGIVPELRSFVLQGSNFTTLDEVDLTPMSNLVEFHAGDECFQKATVLIWEGRWGGNEWGLELTKLKVLSLGSNCFEGGRKIYLISIRERDG